MCSSCSLVLPLKIGDYIIVLQTTMCIRQPRPLRCAAGSLFALEVLHRTGMQFYEVATYAVSCGVICLAVFRALKREAFGAVWDFEHPFVEVDSRHIVVGAPPYQLHPLEFCTMRLPCCLHSPHA